MKFRLLPIPLIFFLSGCNSGTGEPVATESPVAESKTEELPHIVLVEGDRSEAECSLPHPWEFPNGKEFVSAMAKLEKGEAWVEMPVEPVDEGQVGGSKSLYELYELPDEKGNILTVSLQKMPNDVVPFDQVLFGIWNEENEAVCQWEIQK